MKTPKLLKTFNIYILFLWLSLIIDKSGLDSDFALNLLIIKYIRLGTVLFTRYTVLA